MIPSAGFHAWVYPIGWVLAHFLWQGALTALLLAVLLHGLRRRGANARYLAACAALFAMLLYPVFTLIFLLPGYEQHHPPGLDMTTPPAGQNPGSLPFSPLSPANPAQAIIPNSAPSSADLSELEAVRLLWRHIARRIEPFLPACVVFWMIGVLVMSGWRGMGWVGLQRLKNNHVTPIGNGLRDRLDELVHKLHISQPIRILESALSEVPLTIGFLQPVILIPASVLTGLSPAQLEAIVAHELAHVRRHDYLVNLFQTVVETLFFYHPAVWWISSKIRVERERCCDEMASRICGDVLVYVQALARLEELRLYFAQLAMTAGAGNVLSRIRYILKIPGAPSRSANAWITSALCGVSVFLLVVLLQQPALSIFDPSQPLGIFENSADIGLVSSPGSVRFNPSRNEYSIAGQGRRMLGDEEDDLFYVYKEMTGDWSLEATLGWKESAADQHRVGLMCRESLEAGAKQVSTDYWRLSDLDMILATSRVSPHGMTVTQSSDLAEFAGRPVRSRLTRAAAENRFIHEWYHPARREWITVSTSVVEMPDRVLVGLAASSAAEGAAMKAEGLIRDVRVRTLTNKNFQPRPESLPRPSPTVPSESFSSARILSDLTFRPGKPLHVAIQWTGRPGAKEMREYPPAGWVVRDVSANGIVDGGRITWKLEPFTVSNIFTYTVLPSSADETEGLFSGMVGEHRIGGMDRAVIPAPLGIFEHHMDTGQPDAPGSAEYDAQTGEYHILGSDAQPRLAVHCAYRAVWGDFRLAAHVRVENVDTSQPWSGATIFVVDHVGIINKYACIKVFPSNQRATSIWKMGDPNGIWDEGVTIPAAYLREKLQIERRGDTVNIYAMDPASREWVRFESRALHFDDPVHVGISTHSEDPGHYTRGHFTEMEFEPLAGN